MVRKLHIRESIYMIEAIADVKKYYSNIDDDTFMKLIALDPTYRDGSNSVGKYGKWILNLYNKGNLSDNDISSITDVLNQFTIYRNRIQNKDLNSYKSLSALEDVLSTVIDDDSMLTDRQKLRFMKNVKAGRIKTSAEDDYDVVLETPKFIVYVPNTHEASMKLGKGTEWCTAHENPEWYNSYTTEGGKLYIIKDKKSGERWQYSDLKGDFLDENNENFDIMRLMKQDKKLSKFFEKSLGADYYNFDDTWIYDGEAIPENIKKYITKVIVSDTVTRIKDSAFFECKSLESIIIPNTVTSIGDSAFTFCTSLKSITIPDNVTSIEDSTFYYCTDLENITIPNSVTRIGNSAFQFCTSLKSITIPNTVTSIGNGAFDGCTSLTSINIPNGVTSIEGSVFQSCTSLTNITIPNSVTSIGTDAFLNCKSLKSIIIPNSVTSIKHSVFYRCESLRSIIIPNSVTRIGHKVFFGLNQLTVYTDNDYAINYCEEWGVPVKPLTHKESYRKPFKLHIRESD